VPSSVHQHFVEIAINDIVEIASRYHESIDIPTHQELCDFRSTFDTLTQFLSDYKRSVHEKDEGNTPAPSDSMDIEGEKKVIVARCTQNTGQKEVSLLQFLCL
jgi:hypothetical protein